MPRAGGRRASRVPAGSFCGGSPAERGTKKKKLARRCCCAMIFFSAVLVLRAPRPPAFFLPSRGRFVAMMPTTAAMAMAMSSAPDRRNRPRRIAVVGGGASGIFAAVAAAAEAASLMLRRGSTDDENEFSDRRPPMPVEVTVLEASSRTLQKVKVSGGGRCNVLHDARLPLPDYVASYPRGSRQLRGVFASAEANADPAALSSSPKKKKRRDGGDNSTRAGGARAVAAHRFGPLQARQWFESRGVELKTEKDGRMFPVTDSSQTVVDCLLRECQLRGVTIRTGTKVVGVRRGSVPNQELDSDGSLTWSSPVPFLVDVVERGNERDEARRDGSSDSGSRQPSQGSTTAPRSAETHEYDAIVLATGSASGGQQIARALGHAVVPPVPSLFTLSTRPDVQEGGILWGLAGVSLPRARVSFEVAAGPAEAEADPPDSLSPAAGGKRLKKKKKPVRLEQEGPLLVTHHGLSGPAALRLSAFGAVELHRLGYRTALRVHWAPSFGTRDDVFEMLWRQAYLQPKKLVKTVCPLSIVPGAAGGPAECDDGNSPTALGSGTASAIPKRLWSALVSASGLADKTWAEASKKEVRDLASRVAETELAMTGKGTFKEEFVTAGGIDLDQVHTRTMQSKLVPGLFLCGECLNVDGVTGGFNFMNAWSTGYVAGSSAADYVMDSRIAAETDEN